MKYKRVLTLLKIAFILCAFVLFRPIQPCFAAFSISAQPYEGGYDLSFGKARAGDEKISEEISITVTTTIGKQYRVYQRLEKPLTSADGIQLDRNKFKMYTLINSNMRGTLERIEEFPVMSADTVLYTSDTAGMGDSFRLVYTLQPTMDQVAGSYQGRMIYYVVPIDSAYDQAIDTLNMYADLSNEGAVEVSTDSGFKRIRIASSDIKDIKFQAPEVRVSVKGNLGTRYRIYQELGSSMLKGSSGERFDLTKVTYQIMDSKSGVVSKEGDLYDLRSRSLVYTSDDIGSSADIAIKFEPAKDFIEQRADVYTGIINFSIEFDQARTMLDPGFIDSVDVEFDVQPIFRIVAASLSEDGTVAQEGAALLKFGEVGYKAGPKESKVKIKIESNLGKAYLVTQKLSGPLQNEKGNKIPDELFTFELKKETTSDAKLKLEKETIVDAQKDTAIFVSNSKGDGDEFEIKYKLRVTGDTRGGNYSAGVSYSLTEL